MQYELELKPTDAQVAYFSKQVGAPYKTFGDYPKLEYLSEEQEDLWDEALNKAFEFALEEFKGIMERRFPETQILEIPGLNFSYVSEKLHPMWGIKIETENPEAVSFLKTSPLIVSVKPILSKRQTEDETL